MLDGEAGLEHDRARLLAAAPGPRRPPEIPAARRRAAGRRVGACHATQDVWLHIMSTRGSTRWSARTGRPRRWRWPTTSRRPSRAAAGRCAWATRCGWSSPSVAAFVGEHERALGFIERFLHVSGGLLSKRIEGLAAHAYVLVRLGRPDERGGRGGGDGRAGRRARRRRAARSRSPRPGLRALRGRRACARRGVARARAGGGRRRSSAAARPACAAPNRSSPSAGWTRRPPSSARPCSTPLSRPTSPRRWSRASLAFRRCSRRRAEIDERAPAPLRRGGDGVAPPRRARPARRLHVQPRRPRATAGRRAHRAGTRARARATANERSCWHAELRRRRADRQPARGGLEAAL